MANAMDATTLLTSDHEQVRTMFREFDSGAAQTEQLFQRIREALKMHTTIEEEIFYPAVQSKMPDIVKEARQEHQGVDRILTELGRIQLQDIRFSELMRELMQNVEHHAGGEEREMFPNATEMLGMDEMQRLGEQMQKRQNALMGQQGRSAA